MVLVLWLVYSMNRDRVLQITLGILLGSLFMLAMVGTLGYLLWSKFTVSPARPTFAQESKPKQITKVTPTPKSSEPKPEPTESAEVLPKGSYRALIARPNGLSLRSAPNRRSQRLGGIGYKENVIVLEKSEDGEWSKIRSTRSRAEGWVRSGNLKEQ